MPFGDVMCLRAGACSEEGGAELEEDLSLEWWRYREATCSEEVLQLQKKWLLNEEKKVLKKSGTESQIHQNVISGTLDNKQTTRDVNPTTTARQSKTARREEENEYTWVA